MSVTRHHDYARDLSTGIDSLPVYANCTQAANAADITPSAMKRSYLTGLELKGVVWRTSGR
jgi:hypothetical protein